MSKTLPSWENCHKNYNCYALFLLRNMVLLESGSRQKTAGCVNTFASYSVAILWLFCGDPLRRTHFFCSCLLDSKQQFTWNRNDNPDGTYCQINQYSEMTMLTIMLPFSFKNPGNHSAITDQQHDFAFCDRTTQEAKQFASLAKTQCIWLTFVFIHNINWATRVCVVCLTRDVRVLWIPTPYSHSDTAILVETHQHIPLTTRNYLYH